jgi:hypothetical protein
MSIQERFGRMVKRWFARRRAAGGQSRAARAPWWGLEPQGNDAGAYGVDVVEASVPAGEQYWRAARVHHLEPAENGGRHHIFLDVLDERGERIFDALTRVTCDAQTHIVTVEKPLGEPGANLATWGGQVCSAEALGLPGAALPSDRVVGMHADHPDEPPGNTRFHHSFLVVFQLAIREAVAARQAVLKGTVRNGAGRRLLLLVDGEPVAAQTVDSDQSYRFGGLWAATYVLAVEGTEVRSNPVRLDGLSSVTVDLELEARSDSGDKLLAEYVLFGTPDAPGTQTSLLLALDYLLALQPTFGFHAVEATAARRVLIIGDSQAVAIETEEQLVAAGCQVERISGTSHAIEQRLSERIAGSRSAA